MKSCLNCIHVSHELQKTHCDHFDLILDRPEQSCCDNHQPEDISTGGPDDEIYKSKLQQHGAI